MQLQALLALFAGLFGLALGSYLNVVIYRVPRGLSTLRPRSRCPGCERPIGAGDNVPVLSFLLLRGKCRHCGTRISWQYPAVELVTALLFVACFLRFGLSWASPVAMLFCCLMLALAAIDLEHMILPDRITLPFTAVGVLLQPLVGWAGTFFFPPPWGWMAGGLWGAALGAGILLGVWIGWYLLRREEGMGLGDVKMLALIGAFLGWKGLLVSLFLASLSGAVVGLALLPRRETGMKTQLPFGVFLSLGALIALFFGQDIAAWYGGMLTAGG